MFASIDIGGTKMEARLFDADFSSVAVRRTATSVSGFDNFINGLSGQIEWLWSQAGQRVPTGLALAGAVDPATGLAIASNLPTDGHDIGAALDAKFQQTFPILNDCMAFAYSEANDGAGRGAASVLGLIIGTGVGAGLCVNGEIPYRQAGLAVEIGHIGMPARALQALNLPLAPCGCGAQGCVEQYIAGAGLTRLAHKHMGRALTGEEIAKVVAAKDVRAMFVFDEWACLVAETISMLHLICAPDVVVLGGGLSNMPGLVDTVTSKLQHFSLAHAGTPDVRLAEHGDTSGARGAAMWAAAWPN